MPFYTTESAAGGLAAGDRVRFRFVVGERSHADKFEIIGRDEAVNALDIMVPRHEITVGEVVWAAREEMDRLRQTVQWTGPRSDIPLLLAMSDIFVLPTYYREGIPRVLLEAASMGLPLVTTGIAGCSEVAWDGENGLVVPPRDPRALALALGQLLGDLPLRQAYGRRSREIATTRFDVAVIARATANLYDYLLSEKQVPVG